MSRTFEEASHEVSKLLNVSVTEKFPICRIPRCRFYVYSLLELDMSVFTSIILKVYANELRISTKFICGAKFQLEKTSFLNSVCFFLIILNIFCRPGFVSPCFSNGSW